MEIEGRIVVVTGGGSGIGRALCECFHREGAKQVVVADIDGSLRTPSRKHRATSVRCDVAGKATSWPSLRRRRNGTARSICFARMLELPQDLIRVSTTRLRRPMTFGSGVGK